MIPRKLKICKGCEKPKVLYGHGMCQKCYAIDMKKRIPVNVKASQHKKKDPRMSQAYAFEKAYYMWGGANFLTGERMPKDEVCYANCAHILRKGSYEYFRYYVRNIVLLSQEQHALYDNLVMEKLGDRMKEFPNENWEKLFNYEYMLLKEYQDWENSHPKEYRL